MSIARCHWCCRRYIQPEPDPWAHRCGLCIGATIEQKLLAELVSHPAAVARKPPLRAGDARLLDPTADGPRWAPAVVPRRVGL
jgi:hypothetical protein